MQAVNFLEDYPFKEDRFQVFLFGHAEFQYLALRPRLAKDT
jgi:hypothetical protein